MEGGRALKRRSKCACRWRADPTDPPSRAPRPWRTCASGPRARARKNARAIAQSERRRSDRSCALARVVLADHDRNRGRRQHPDLGDGHRNVLHRCDVVPHVEQFQAARRSDRGRVMLCGMADRRVVERTLASPSTLGAPRGSRDIVLGHRGRPIRSSRLNRAAHVHKTASGRTHITSFDRGASASGFACSLTLYVSQQNKTGTLCERAVIATTACRCRNAV